jgi:acyl-CoA thioester hydrolase
MVTHEVQIRVRYAETDKMGYVYYGNYATYLEVGRVETIRHIGFSYKELEDAGIMMPVLEYKSKFLKPARYDDMLLIKVYIKNKPSARILFEYEVFNQDGILLTVAETTLVFVNSRSGKPCLPPKLFQELTASYFDEKTA